MDDILSVDLGRLLLARKVKASKTDRCLPAASGESGYVNGSHEVRLPLPGQHQDQRVLRHLL